MGEDLYSIAVEFGEDVGATSLPKAQVKQVEYLGAVDALHPRFESEANFNELKRLLSEFARVHYGNGVCRFQLRQNPDEVRVRIHLGGVPTSRADLEAYLYPDDGFLDSMPWEIHQLTYRRHTGRLIVDATSPCARSHYRRSFGQAYWDDEGHFDRILRYSAEPFVMRGQACLEGLGVGALRMVMLERIGLATASGSERAEWKLPDLARRIQSPNGQYLLRHRHISHYSINLVFSDSSSDTNVDVQVPDRGDYKSSPVHGLVGQCLMGTGLLHAAQIREGADG